MKGTPHTGGRLLLLGKILIVLVAFALLGFFDGAIGKAIGAYDVVAYKMAPSAQRAAMYGERHFDSRTHSILYDIRLAEYFYRELEKLDRNYPYLYHQLARIEFLRGNLEIAMIYINKQIELHGKDTPNSYYMRGLIEGYNGDYDAAVRDYAYFQKTNPGTWAGANDYAWVLLKADKAKEAAEVTGGALKQHPGNAWLLSTRSIALYEIGDLQGALNTAREALVAVSITTEGQWLVAYPGNDPRIARQGMETHRRSIEDNIHKIEAAIAESAIQ